MFLVGSERAERVGSLRPRLARAMFPGFSRRRRPPHLRDGVDRRRADRGEARQVLRGEDVHDQELELLGDKGGAEEHYPSRPAGPDLGLPRELLLQTRPAPRARRVWGGAMNHGEEPGVKAPLVGRGDV